MQSGSIIHKDKVCFKPAKALLALFVEDIVPRRCRRSCHRPISALWLQSLLSHPSVWRHGLRFINNNEKSQSTEMSSAGPEFGPVCGTLHAGDIVTANVGIWHQSPRREHLTCHTCCSSVFLVWPWTDSESMICSIHSSHMAGSFCSWS